MRSIVAILVLALCVAAAANAGPNRAEKLTPKETAWVKPVLKLWTNMNTGLKGVIAEATAPKALSVGTQNNLKLTETLAAFVQCGPQLKKAGKAPTPRLKEFASSMSSMCAHMRSAGTDMAQAIAALRKNNTKVGEAKIKSMGDELKKATAYLKQAASQIVAIGGQQLPTA